MSMLDLISRYRSIGHEQWLSRKQIHHLQVSRLVDLLRDAYENVPYYRSLFDRAGLKPQQIRTLDDLRRIPISSKADLQSVSDQQRLNCRFSENELVTESTSGSTGRPFTMLFDREFVNVRNSLFMRGLRAIGYRFGDKLLLVTSRRRVSRKWYRWKYLSIESSAQTLVDDYARFKPKILYGCKTPLCLMAQFMARHGTSYHRPHAVVTTAESLDESSRKLLEDTFGAPVFDFYGLTEVGLLAWQCQQQTGYHLSEDTTIIELQPDRAANSYRLIVTSLFLKSMPLIRYQTGDLVSSVDDGVCGCGRHLRRIQRIDGREVDCLITSGGNRISPYRVTCALESIAELTRFQVIQESPDHFTVLAETERSAADLVERKVRERLTSIVGNDASIQVNTRERLTTQSDHTFRVVERRFLEEQGNGT